MSRKFEELSKNFQAAEVVKNRVALLDTDVVISESRKLSVKYSYPG